MAEKELTEQELLEAEAIKESMDEFKSLSLDKKLESAREEMLNTLYEELLNGNSRNVSVLQQMLTNNNITQDKKTEVGNHDKVEKIIKRQKAKQ